MVSTAFGAGNGGSRYGVEELQVGGVVGEEEILTVVLRPHDPTVVEDTGNWWYW